MDQPLDSSARPATAAVRLEASGIDKTFGRTVALRAAHLAATGGEVHGLLGANGAGKSTLSKIVAGLLRPDAGRLLLNGRDLHHRRTRDALEAGIAIVMQETMLAPDLSVLENVFLPELGRPGRLSYGALRRRASELLASLGHEHALPLDREVRRLGAAQRQLVEIAKALALDANVIIFDEPTASLSPSEVERLFTIMARLRDEGRALIFVSHRLEEVFAITDRVTVMREGRTVADAVATTSLGQGDLVKLMVGQEIGSIYAVPGMNHAADDGPVTLEVRSLASPPAVRDVSFAVRRGEILGIGGLVGAGRSETAEAIFALRPLAGGTIHLNGEPFRPRRPADCVRAGIGFVAEDRRVQGIVPHLSVKENLLLAHLGAHRGFGLGYRQRQAKIDELLALLEMPSHRLLDANMLEFSGGMQQKIIIARWLLLDPHVLILDEPTKGVDIGTRSSIYAMLRDIAARGVSIVVISSDFEELLGISERIVVMSDGVTIADVPSAVLDEEKLTLLAAPRTSMTRNTELLQALTREHGGAGFWALLDDRGLICLNAVVDAEAADPGFRAGEVKRFEETRIPDALASRAGGFVGEATSARHTLLVPLRSPRGHDLGWLGLTLPAAGDADGQAITERIRAEMASW